MFRKVFVVVIVTVACLFAQDMIVKCTGEVVRGYLFNISDSHVIYKLDTLDRVQYSVKRNEIQTVILENGRQEIFGCDFPKMQDVKNTEQKVSLRRENLMSGVFSVRTHWLVSPWNFGYGGISIEAGRIGEKGFYFTAEPSFGFGDHSAYVEYDYYYIPYSGNGYWTTKYDYAYCYGFYFGNTFNFGRFLYWGSKGKVKTVIGSSAGLYWGLYDYYDSYMWTYIASIYDMEVMSFSLGAGPFWKVMFGNNSNFDITNRFLIGFNVNSYDYRYSYNREISTMKFAADYRFNATYMVSIGYTLVKPKSKR